MEKLCKVCAIQLTPLNAAKKNKKYFRNTCKPCRSKECAKWNKVHNDKVNARVRDYVRRIGSVRQYECLTCKVLCYKRYKHAFCSDKCRFESYIEKSDKCWIWIGGKNRSGYGKFSMNGKTVVASRFSYYFYKGSIPDGKFVCHLCDIPSCVNPSHLWIGNNVENVLDSALKGRLNYTLSINTMKKIKKDIASGVRNKDIQMKYKISSSTVSNVKYGRIWKYIKI